MTATTKPLTDREVKNLAAPAAGRLEVGDGSVTGLTLRVTPNGVKTWALVYKAGGQKKRLTLGAYPGLSLADARRNTPSTVGRSTRTAR